MMHLENKTITIKDFETGLEAEVKYGELIVRALDFPPPQTGFSREETRKRDRVEDIIINSNGKFEFETAEGETVKEICELMPWSIRGKGMLQFHDDIAAMEETAK